MNKAGNDLMYELLIIYIILYSGDYLEMPFYRILLVTRNDLAVASLYNKFVETAKYVMDNGGIFQRIYNTGDHLFRYNLNA